MHDFLTGQPVHGADVYFFRAVLHNWSDKYAVRILQNIVPALRPGSKVVIQDSVIPEPENVAKPKEAMLRTGTMGMHVLFNSADREMKEWARRFHEADARFHFKGGNQPTGSNMWILEAEWKGSSNDN